MTEPLDPTTPRTYPAGTPVAPGTPVPPVAPAAPASSFRRWTAGGLSARIVLTLAGAGGLILGGLLDWVGSRSGVNLGVRALWTTGIHEGRTFLTTVGFVVIVLGLLAIVGLAPSTGWLTRLAGALGIVVFVLFAIQVSRADAGIESIEAGAWVTLAGSVVALVGGFFGSRVWVAPGGYAPA